VLRDFSRTSFEPLFIVSSALRMGRQASLEFHVDDGADHLRDMAGGVRDFFHFFAIADVLASYLVEIATGDRFASERLGARNDFDQFFW